MRFIKNKKKLISIIVMTLIMTMPMIALNTSGIMAATNVTINASERRIYANGDSLVIEGTDATHSTIFIDLNRNGIKDVGEESLNDASITGAPVDNSDLSGWEIYGGAETNDGNYDTLLTMNGGCVNALIAGGRNGSVTGNTFIVMNGGEISWQIIGASYYNGSDIIGNSSIEMNGGYAKWINITASNGSKVKGNSSLVINGGRTLEIFGDEKVTGTKEIIINGGSVQKNGNATIPKNANGEELEMYTMNIQNIGSGDVVKKLHTNPTYNYGVKDIYIGINNTDSAYVWLPKLRPATSIVVSTDTVSYFSLVSNKTASLNETTTTAVVAKQAIESTLSKAKVTNETNEQGINALVYKALESVAAPHEIAWNQSNPFHLEKATTSKAGLISGEIDLSSVGNGNATVTLNVIVPKVIVNSNISTAPETGDTTNFSFMVSLLSLSGFVLFVSLRYTKNTNK